MLECHERNLVVRVVTAVVVVISLTLIPFTVVPEFDKPSHTPSSSDSGVELRNQELTLQRAGSTSTLTVPAAHISTNTDSISHQDGTIMPDTATTVMSQQTSRNGAHNLNKPTQQTSVAVRIDGAPNGLQKYSIRINTNTNATISSIEPGFIRGRFFRVTGGGVGGNSVTTQGVDFLGTKTAFDNSKRFFTLTFETALTRDSIDVVIEQLSDDDGDQIDRNRISVIVISAGTTFREPLGDNTELPKDPDRDGLYEDINGDGRIGIRDAVDLALLRSGSLENNQITTLDFNGDGKISLLDGLALLFDI